MTTSNLKYRLKKASVITKLIIINVVLFILFKIMSLAPGSSVATFERLFLLPYDFSDFLQQPWSLFTYSFFHGSIWHVGMNMFILYWVGEFVLNLFSAKRFLTVYFLGAMAGGALFLLLYDVMPFDMKTIAFGWSFWSCHGHYGFYCGLCTSYRSAYYKMELEALAHRCLFCGIRFIPISDWAESRRHARTFGRRRIWIFVCQTASQRKRYWQVVRKINGRNRQSFYHKKIETL